jgi:hypothetical protein
MFVFAHRSGNLLQIAANFFPANLAFAQFGDEAKAAVFIINKPEITGVNNCI